MAATDLDEALDLADVLLKMMQQTSEYATEERCNGLLEL